MADRTELFQKFLYLKTLANVDKILKNIDDLRIKYENPDFWNNPKEAAKVSEDLKNLEVLLSKIKLIEDNFELLNELEDNDADQQLLLDENSKLIKELELELQFDEEFDHNDAYLEIHPGAGGTESQDWADMLFRMYVRFCERHHFKVNVLDRIDGDEAGIKMVSLEIQGKNVFGLLKSEKGVHRLVRISPFDSNHRRHTSFASVMVTPVISNDVVLDIPDKDLRIDTYRSQGAGGQNVNKTESAVRITHIPTGLMASCQTERSQTLNKETALRSLKSKLYEIEYQKQASKLEKITGTKSNIEWGSQIRSYVFCPYTLVKDSRTSYEECDVNKVMDGHIDGFIYSYLKFIKE